MDTYINIELWQFLLAVVIFIGSICTAWGTIKTKVKHLEKDFDRIESKVDNGFVELRTTFLSLNAQALGNAHSPYQPNEEGQRILRESNWNDVYQTIRDEIISFMESARPQTLYDVEQIAFAAISRLKNDPRVNPLKNYSVQHPQYPLDVVFYLASWNIRDDYSSLHPEVFPKEP